MAGRRPGSSPGSWPSSSPAPAFLWVESHQADPLLDLRLFRNRLFATGQPDGPVERHRAQRRPVPARVLPAGRAGRRPRHRRADARATRDRAARALADQWRARRPLWLPRCSRRSGMLVTAVGLLGLVTLQVDTPYWQLALWQLIIGAGSGLFNSPNTSAVMSVVPPAQRGMGAGARMMLVQTGFIISIALSIGLVASVVSTGGPARDLLRHAGRLGGRRPRALHDRAPRRVRRRRRGQPARRRRVGDARPPPRRGRRSRPGGRGRGMTGASGAAGRLGGVHRPAGAPRLPPPQLPPVLRRPGDLAWSGPGCSRSPRRGSSCS